METITTTIKAWLPKHNDASQLRESDDKAVSALCFSTHNMLLAGWALVGEADITVRLVDDDTLIQNQVAALEKQRDDILADAQQKCNYINDRISKLSALTYEPATV